MRDIDNVFAESEYDKESSQEELTQEEIEFIEDKIKANS